MQNSEPLLYNGKALLKERKKQKLSRTDIASQLTLSEEQIKSIEENMRSSFANDHFRKLSIKRYAKLLGLSVANIIPEDPNKNIEPTILDDVKKFDFKKKIFLLPFALIFLFPLLFFIFNQSKEDLLEKPVTLEEGNAILTPPLDETLQDELPIVFDEKDMLLGEAKIPAEQVSTNNISLDFICTIDTADGLTNFSTKNPEKPSTYFHLISYEAQTFCALDSNNILKTYNLAKGERLTHKGMAPFKIQLDPKRSELYFEGWKVQLQNNDFFIKLNPGKIKEQD